MRTRPKSIFSRIGIFIFLVITALGVSFVLITYNATSDYYQASLQLLNKDEAPRIAALTPLFSKQGIDHHKADSVFDNTMIVSPNTEVYFLDTLGHVQYYYAPDSLIKERRVPTDKIKIYLKDNLHLIRNIDPRDPETPKIFSAAQVKVDHQKIGYIYIVLASKEYRNVAEFVFKSQVGGWATKVFFMIIFATIIFSLLYISRLQRSYNRVIHVLDQFKNGDLNVRFDTKENDEFFPIADAFNKMVAMLGENFRRLKLLEEERRVFLANISHDLRTPLAVARGYTETMLIEKPATYKEQESHLEMVLSKIMQVEKLVLQLFELSKMESVNFIPNKEPFIFSEILQETIKGAEFQAKQKSIEIRCENCEDNALIDADISMMERVVQNLLENAVKYTHPGGFIKIRLLREPGLLTLELENSGDPLPPAILNWVNDATDEDAIKRPKGAGLGLALVKRVLKLHGFKFKADLSAESANKFVISLDSYTYPVKKIE